MVWRLSYLENVPPGYIGDFEESEGPQRLVECLRMMTGSYSDHFQVEEQSSSCVGGEHSQLGETMSVMGVSIMTKSSFIDTERAIGVEAGAVAIDG